MYQLNKEIWVSKARKARCCSSETIGIQAQKCGFAELSLCFLKNCWEDRISPIYSPHNYNFFSGKKMCNNTHFDI